MPPSSGNASIIRECLHHHSLMMQAENASDTLDFCSILTQLVARDFIAFSHSESFKSYFW
jgi:hypothetical protein